MKPFKNTGFTHFFFIPIILIFIGAFTIFLILFVKSQQTKFWIRKEAKIEFLEMKESKSSKGRSTNYKVDIHYSFDMDGKKYVNDGLSIGYSYNNFEDNFEVYETLKSAKKIIVYMNPNDYTESVIVPGVNRSITFFFAFSLLGCSILSIFILPIFWKENKEPNEIFNNKS